jgi:phage terminase large subunit-like protein
MSIASPATAEVPPHDVAAEGAVSRADSEWIMLAVLAVLQIAWIALLALGVWFIVS